MDSKDALVVFEGKKVRRTWNNKEWWFVLEDIVYILTDSSDPKQYIQKMKQRDEPLAKGWVQIVHTLAVDTSGGRQKMNCVNTEGAFRIIQSIPSPKAEPFKRWLARVGYERIQEIENPELGQDRVKEYYELKGYPDDWIDKRLRGIAIRQDLTDEWRTRGIQEKKDFAILTNEISKATFGKTVGEYKKFKSLERDSQNLRDHMTDWKLILTMVGEKATTDITISKDSQGLEECRDSAVDGGTIAKNTRKELEQKIGKTVISNENYLNVTGKKQRKLLHEGENR
ncbi:MAG TPA: Bro-N domain-containing protein [Candidatus Methanoperedens sp.]